MLHAIWDRRDRVARRLAIRLGDVQRAAAWHFNGGKTHFERYADVLLSAQKWCFIVGCNNSGTSLIQTILDRSGQVSTLPAEGQRYTATLRRAQKRGHERVWSEYLDELRMDEGDRTVHVPRLLHDWMRQFPLPIRNIAVEKTTANAVRMAWLQEVFPHSYFIGLVRNGYAVTEGIVRKGAKSVERAARHWNLVNKLMVNDSPRIHNLLIVRYEDIVEKPGQCAARLAEFTGLDRESLVNALQGEYALKTKRGWKRQLVRNFNEECIDRLTPSDIRLTYTEAAEMLDYYGYKPDGSYTTEHPGEPIL